MLVSLAQQASTAAVDTLLFDAEPALLLHSEILWVRETAGRPADDERIKRSCSGHL